MDPKDAFYGWFPSILRLPVLFILLFALLTANGIFPGNFMEMSNDLGVYPENFTLAYNSLFIGISVGLLIEARLKQRFTNKTLLILGLTGMIAMNVITASTHNPVIIATASFFLGVLKVSAYAEIFLVWLFVWSPSRSPARVYPFLFFIVLAGSNLVNWVMARVAYAYNWRYAYLTVIILLLVCLLMVLLFIKKQPLKRPVPLYQMDRPGLLLLVCSMQLLNYAFVYAMVEDLFHSLKIQWALLGSLITFIWFIKRELRARHPLIPMKLFRQKNLAGGLLVFLIAGMFSPPTVQLSYTTIILKYDMVQNMQLNLYMIPGITAACVLSYWWYYQSRDPLFIMFSGFAAMVIYQALLFKGFAVDFPMNGFWWPSIAKGFGTAALFISYGLYTISNFEPARIMTVAGIMVMVRSFVANAFFTSVYSYILYALRTSYLQQMIAGTAGNNPDTGVLTPTAQLRYYTERASLVAAKELTGYILSVGILACMIIIIYAIARGVLYQNVPKDIEPSTM